MAHLNLFSLPMLALIIFLSSMYVVSARNLKPSWPEQPPHFGFPELDPPYNFPPMPYLPPDIETKKSYEDNPPHFGFPELDPPQEIPFLPPGVDYSIVFGPPGKF
ncbi:hypothetical protein CASFOL_038849 [Castilleja foliolosa]|uniref:Uncharacterized protein n=1 Tax=Castilleja foliolosa TaxID=1961234 RepID=A0ABD3BJB8_9LAMI